MENLHMRRRPSWVTLGLGLMAALAGCADGKKGGAGGAPDGGAAAGAGGAAAGAGGMAQPTGGTTGATGGYTGTGGMVMTPPDGGAPATGAARKIPTQGSAVAITADDKYAVAANRTAGRVTVFRLEFGGATPATKLVDLDVGKTSEPWAVVIGNDDDSAYVILRKDQQVVRIRNLRTSPAVDTMKARTGSEPTGLAISPTGATLYVANWSEGTVSVIDTATLSVMKTVDLNGALAASGMLGAGVTARPALAHPRAIVVTNDGDASDANERVYVTEFFAQARTDTLPEDDSRFDVGRQGVVYSFDAAGTVGPLITLAPVADTGFADSKGQKTGCFPNQLYAAAINNSRLYVTSVCESPRGPVGPDAAPVAPGTGTSNFKTQVHAAVFVVDLATGKELPAQGLLLTREFDKMYAAASLPDDAGRRMPLIPNDIMFAAGTSFAYVSGYGSDAVFRIAYKADGSLERVGAASQPFINLKPTGGAVAPGELPVGLASANAGAATVSFALAINENSRNLSVLGFGTQAVVAAVPATDPPAAGAETAVNRGQKFFVTGLGRWSLAGQAWNSCAACHPDGLTDNATWFFGRGPRQTTSLDGSYDPKNPAKRRVLNWTGIFDELHDFENNTRGNSGGVGAFVHRAGPPVAASDRIIFDGTAPAAEQQATTTPQTGLTGSMISMMPGGPTTPNTVLPDWNEIDAYVKAIRAPRAPANLAATDVAAGKTLFEANGCAGCHGTSQWTISQVFYNPSEANNSAMGLLRSTSYTRPAGFPVALNPPSAMGGTAPLRFNGANPAANDQINCVLRDVGTFGVAAPGVALKEVRQDMSTAAQGATGFNIPSLLGMVTGAPYFHGGAARTLEEALGDAFDGHRRAFAENFRPDATQVRQLAAFLLSIDEDTAPPAVPMLGFPVDLCAQIPAGTIQY
jgi:YVTN family beta-propeller protein